jgi:putative oxidoreductase
MRLVAGSALIMRASSTLWGEAPINTTIMAASLAGCGVLLIPGLWTPIAGTLAASIEAWQILTRNGDLWVLLLLGTIAGALAMLGPGMWSVDARLFGWKRVEAPPHKSSSTSR